jgi:hypothetical protein
MHVYPDFYKKNLLHCQKSLNSWSTYETPLLKCKSVSHIFSATIDGELNLQCEIIFIFILKHFKFPYTTMATFQHWNNIKHISNSIMYLLTVLFITCHILKLFIT